MSIANNAIYSFKCLHSDTQKFCSESEHKKTIRDNFLNDFKIVAALIPNHGNHPKSGGLDVHKINGQQVPQNWVCYSCYVHKYTDSKCQAIRLIFFHNINLRMIIMTNLIVDHKYETFSKNVGKRNKLILSEIVNKGVKHLQEEKNV